MCRHRRLDVSLPKIHGYYWVHLQMVVELKTIFSLCFSEVWKFIFMEYTLHLFSNEGIHFSSKLKCRLDSYLENVPWGLHSRYSAGLSHLPKGTVWRDDNLLREVRPLTGPTGCIFGNWISRGGICSSVLNFLLVPKTETLGDGFTRPIVLEHSVAQKAVSALKAENQFLTFGKSWSFGSKV